MTFSIQWIRKMILVAMVLIVFSNVAQWVGEFFPKIVGAIWGIATAGVAYFCRTKAMKSHTAVVDKKYYLWLMVPVVLTLIPVVFRIRKIFTEESQSGWIRLWEAMPVLVNFILPVGILWVAYAALTQHMKETQIDVPASSDDETQVERA